jgi:hypothetical protein
MDRWPDRAKRTQSLKFSGTITHTHCTRAGMKDIAGTAWVKFSKYQNPLKSTSKIMFIVTEHLLNIKPFHLYFKVLFTV